MSFLLREVLLQAIGIEGDLGWTSSGSNPSAIDITLLPPGSAALISKIQHIGGIYKKMEELSVNAPKDAYSASVANSIEVFLDNFRYMVVAADTEIAQGTLETLTWLIAKLDPFFLELPAVGEILPSLMLKNPLEKMDFLYKLVTTSNPSIAERFRSFETALHQVTISQLEAFIFYQQSLPDIFEEQSDHRISFINQQSPTFINHQHSEWLILVVNTAHRSPQMFEQSYPPNSTSLTDFIFKMVKMTSVLLVERIKIQWPPFLATMKQALLGERDDFLCELAQRMNDDAPDFELSTISREFGVNILETPTGYTLRLNRPSPLDLIVTDAHQNVLSQFFFFLIDLQRSELALCELWKNIKGYKKTQQLIFLLRQIFTTIREYLVFSVILPSIIKLEETSEKLSDFLVFQNAFQLFISNFVYYIPVKDETSLGLIREVCFLVIDLQKSVDVKGSEGGIVEQVIKCSKKVVAHINEIEFLPVDERDQGTGLIKTLESLTKKIEDAI